MSKKIKTRKGKDGYSYPYTSPDLVIDDTGKSNTTKFNEIDTQFKDIEGKQITLEKDDTSFDGVDDTIHDNLTTTDKRIIGAINEVNTQCKDIANKFMYVTEEIVYKNIFDKENMIDTTKGISSLGVITNKSGWNIAIIPVKSNTKYSIKKVELESYAPYNGKQTGNLGFLNSSKDVISSLCFLQSSEINSSTLATYPQAVSVEEYSHNKTRNVDWITVTTPSNCSYLAFNTNLQCTADTIQVEEGDEIHDYYIAYTGVN